MRRIKGIVFIVSVLMRGEHIFASFMPYFLLTGYSLWLKQCSIPFRYAHHQAGENPELRTLFYRLARLHRLPVAVIVVFDGDAGPPIKRGVQVIRNRHWLEEPFRMLVRLFGFVIHSVCSIVPLAAHDVLNSHTRDLERPRLSLLA
jgi:hypothetical protein